MLVEGQQLRGIGRVLVIGAAIPVGKGMDFSVDVLAVVALGKRCAAATGLVGHANSKALVTSGRKQRSLTEPRATGDDTPLRVDFRDALGEIEPARKRPSPRPERGDIVRTALVALAPKIEDAGIGKRLLLVGGLLVVARIRRNFANTRSSRVAAREDHRKREDAVGVRVLHHAARAF